MTEVKVNEVVRDVVSVHEFDNETDCDLVGSSDTVAVREATADIDRLLVLLCSSEIVVDLLNVNDVV